MICATKHWRPTLNAPSPVQTCKSKALPQVTVTFDTETPHLEEILRDSYIFIYTYITYSIVYKQNIKLFNIYIFSFTVKMTTVDGRI